MGAMRPASVLLLFFLLSACVSPRHAPPTPTLTAAEAERRILEEALDLALTRRARVYDLAQPVLTANTALCPETRRSVGLVIADRKTLGRLGGGLRERDIETLGVPKGPRIIHAIAGSPASESGLSIGTRITAVEGEAVETATEAIRSITDRLDDEETVTVETADGAVTLTGEEMCDVAVKISTSQSLNAHASTGDIVIYTGLIRRLSDPALQFVIAHELAHVTERHPRKYVYNAGVSGTLFVGPPLFLLAALADGALGAVGAKPDTPLTARTARAMLPWASQFEAEADYVGLYFFARAGGDLSAVDEVFEMFGTETPSSNYVRATHPLTPDRLIQLDASRAEVDAKRARGEPLIPERAE